LEGCAKAVCVATRTMAETRVCRRGKRMKGPRRKCGLSCGWRVEGARMWASHASKVFATCMIMPIAAHAPRLAAVVSVVLFKF
jgi:hypothetical protein